MPPNNPHHGTNGKINFGTDNDKHHTNRQHTAMAVYESSLEIFLVTPNATVCLQKEKKTTISNMAAKHGKLVVIETWFLLFFKKHSAVILFDRANHNLSWVKPWWSNWPFLKRPSMHQLNTLFTDANASDINEHHDDRHAFFDECKHQPYKFRNFGAQHQYAAKSVHLILEFGVVNRQFGDNGFLLITRPLSF